MKELSTTNSDVFVTGSANLQPSTMRVEPCADDTYVVNAMDMNGTIITDISVSSSQYQDIARNVEKTFSVSYSQQEFYQNRAARRKKKRKER